MARSKSSAVKMEDAEPKADPVVSGSKITRNAPKLVPLQKRLGKLRRLEAKRQRQLSKVQAKATRTTTEMAALLESVNEWVKHPQTNAAQDAAPSNGTRELAKAER